VTTWGLGQAQIMGGIASVEKPLGPGSAIDLLCMSVFARKRSNEMTCMRPRCWHGSSWLYVSHRRSAKFKVIEANVPFRLKVKVKLGNQFRPRGRKQAWIGN